MPLAAATKESSPSAAIPANAQQAKSRPGIVPKMICGIGVTFALAVVAAAVMSNPPEPSPGPVAPVMPVHVTEKTAPSPSNRAVSTTPAGAVPAPLVAHPMAPVMPVYSAEKATPSPSVGTMQAPPVADPMRPMPPVSAVAPAPPPKQCDQPQRKFYVSGNGTVRIHDGTDVSAPVVLDVYPQEVIFPTARPAAGASEETITVEGNASAVVMTSDLPSFRRTFYHLKGAASFIAHWVSLRNCEVDTGSRGESASKD
jgi:hypothetical protein